MGTGRLERDLRHFERSHECYYRPACLRCWLYAYIDLFRLWWRVRKVLASGGAD